MKPEANFRQSSQPPQDIGRLPLFPLKTWLYPGVPLHLQVFEQRYLDMISGQLKLGQGFGVVPIRQGKEVGAAPQIYPVGVEVLVTDWDQMPSGMLGLRVTGERKFRILDSAVDDNQLITANVEFLRPDRPETIGIEFEGLVDLLATLKDHPAARETGLPDALDTSQLSYQLAWLLPMHAEEKLAALTLSSATARLQLLASKVAELSQE